MAKAAAAQAGTETRDLIVQAALEAFTEKGFEGASTREIATRVGVNHGLIPYYFRTKQRLWQAAVDLAFADMTAGIESALADPSISDDRERARRMIRAHVHFVARRPEFVRLMYEEGKRRGPRMRWMVDRYVKPQYDAVVQLLEHGGATNTIAGDIAPIHFFYVLAGATGLIFHQAEECKRVSGVDPFDPEVVEVHARFVELLLLGPDNDEAVASRGVI
jgi:AcrR family transcriptional regulator